MLKSKVVELGREQQRCLTARVVSNIFSLVLAFLKNAEKYSLRTSLKIIFLNKLSFKTNMLNSTSNLVWMFEVIVCNLFEGT